MSDVLERLQEVIAGFLDSGVKDIKLSSLLDELVPDEFDRKEMIFKVEAEFGFNFLDKYADSFHTVQDIFDFVACENRDVLAKVSVIISDVMGIPLASVKPASTLLGGLNIDSLDAVSMLARLEEECEIEIPGDIAEGFKTVKNIVDFIAKLPK